MQNNNIDAREELLEGLLRIVCNVTNPLTYRRAAMEVVRRIIQDRDPFTIRRMENERGLLKTGR